MGKIGMFKVLVVTGGLVKVHKLQRLLFMKILISVLGLLMPVAATCAQVHVSTISVDTVHEMQIEEKSFLLIDCRPRTDYRVKHIKGAVSIPLFELGFKKLPKKIDLILYCSGIGCNISIRGARKLLGYGYKRVLVMEEGLAGWEKRGYPVVVLPESRQVERDEDER